LTRNHFKGYSSMIMTEDKRNKINKIIKTKKAQNSWGNVANWYDNNLDNPNTYQSQVILPNLTRLLDLKKSDTLLDLACGQGFFCAKYENLCTITGVDISPELIDIAIENTQNTQYYVCRAERIETLPLKPFTKVLTVLALQNIQDLAKTMFNLSNLMTKGSKWYIVLNHPSFRQLRKSAWVMDRENGIQTRSLTGYMSSYTQEILMNPSKKNSEKTLTYHRPLQEYIKIAKNNNMVLTNLEEWISHTKQDTEVLETAKKEFPMFMYLEFEKK
jgi:ubiquinone/menaquinone biosynthesis C-methylase UbiE